MRHAGGHQRRVAVRTQLGRRPEVDHGREPDLVTKLGDVFLAQPVERVAAKEPPPANRAAVGRRIATQVAEVVTAVERDGPLHPADHSARVERSHPAPHQSGRTGDECTACAKAPA